MAFDGFTLNAVVHELQNILIGGKIDKIYQPNNDEILLGIYSNKKHYLLTCNTSFNNYSLHLTTLSKINPLTAPNFCMVLRKHCIGYIIKSIYTNGLERIAIMEIEGYNELNDLITKRIVIELMGKHSNIILINSEDIIIDSLKHFNTLAGSYRNILPNYKYVFPNNTKINLNCCTSSSIANVTNSNLIDFFVNNFTGISSLFITSIIKKFNLTNITTKENIEFVYQKLQEYLKCIKSNQVTLEYFDNDYVMCITNDVSNLKVNFFLDDYYFAKESNENYLEYKKNVNNLLNKKIKNIESKIENIDLKLQECNKMDLYKLYGELLTNYMYKIDNTTHQSSIFLNNYYNNNESIEIPLDIKLLPSENAKKYFKKYHKLKNTLSIVSAQKIELKKYIEYLNSIQYELENTKNMEEISDIICELQNENICVDSLSKKNTFKSKNINKKEKEKEKEKEKIINTNTYNIKNINSVLIDNYKVFIGKNNKQNDYLTTKVAKANDLWFHTKDIPGSHVILQINDKNFPNNKTIMKCAEIAAYFSKASQSCNVCVDYTFAKFVKKPSKSKPGMVIYTNQTTLVVNPKFNQN